MICPDLSSRSPNRFASIDTRRVMQNAAQRRKEADEARLKKKEELMEQQRERVGAKAKDPSRPWENTLVKPDPKLGEFEKHTKGIGMKLLEKMGYKKGMGLGKDGSGMAAPMETMQRPKNMGMGFKGFKESGQLNNKEDDSDDDRPKGAPGGDGRNAAADKVAAEDLQRKREKERKEKEMWKRRNELKRERREYKTAEEVLAEQERADLEAAGIGTERRTGASNATPAPAKMTVIDMRGSQAHVVTDLRKLDKPGASGRNEADDEDDIAFPELQHNLRLIVDLAEAEIQTMDAKCRHEKDTQTLLRRESERLAVDSERIERLADSLDAVLRLAEKCEVSAQSQGATLEDLATMYGEMKAHYPHEYATHGVHRLAMAHAHPLVAAMFPKDAYDPLAEPTRGVERLRPWRDLLCVGDGYTDGGIFGTDTDDAVYGLVSESVIQPLRRAISNNWDPKSPEPLLRFFDNWSTSVLSTDSVEELQVRCVLPVLERAVNEWNPLTDPVPIHQWLHPWLPSLGTAASSLWAPIRHKLTNALSAWHPSDTSALGLLAPWRSVFDQRDWDALLTRSILPKLQYALQTVVIDGVDRANQSLEPMGWVLAWEGCIPAGRMTHLLESGFFPKFHAALHAYLSTPGVDLEEVTRWYLEWKQAFSEDLLAHERVRRQINMALDAMNRATTGDGNLGPSPAEQAHAAHTAAKAAKEAERRRVAESEAERRGRKNDDFDADMSLREAVEAFAEANDLAFMPKPGRTHEGLQVYSFGKVSVVVDSAGEMLRASIGDRWAPVSLDQLLEAHKAKLRAKSKAF